MLRRMGKRILRTNEILNSPQPHLPLLFLKAIYFIFPKPRKSCVCFSFAKRVKVALRRGAVVTLLKRKKKKKFKKRKENANPTLLVYAKNTFLSTALDSAYVLK
eukprot:TRINITY_DN641_c1_g2_i1.p1 TRINITY_DN641_c1_g2~~TRINITY_DN641_c1_g2_i1.p1  ORF type:complete len:104 (+),score=4.77 TRINITY_DN641_c1_g2_i1:847-1158(+)